MAVGSQDDPGAGERAAHRLGKHHQPGATFGGKGQPFVHIGVAGIETRKTLNFFFQPPFFLQNRGQGFGIVPRAGA